MAPPLTYLAAQYLPSPPWQEVMTRHLLINMACLTNKYGLLAIVTYRTEYHRMMSLVVELDKGWTAGLAGSLWFVVPKIGSELTLANLKRFETLYLTLFATPPSP